MICEGQTCYFMYKNFLRFIAVSHECHDQVCPKDMSRRKAARLIAQKLTRGIEDRTHGSLLTRSTQPNSSAQEGTLLGRHSSSNSSRSTPQLHSSCKKHTKTLQLFLCSFFFVIFNAMDRRLRVHIRIRGEISPFYEKNVL